MGGHAFFNNFDDRSRVFEEFVCHFKRFDHGRVDTFGRVANGVRGLVHVTQNKDRVYQNDGEKNTEQCDADRKNNVEKIEGGEHGRKIREILAKYKIRYL